MRLRFGRRQGWQGLLKRLGQLPLPARIHWHLAQHHQQLIDAWLADGQELARVLASQTGADSLRRGMKVSQNV